MPFYALIKLFVHAVPLFGRLTHELSAVSGLGGGDDPSFGPIDTRMDGPVEPLTFRFCR